MGDKPSDDEFEEDPDDPQVDPHYTGCTERTLENNSECYDPELIKKVALEDRAMWLGKWFAHHYAPWVSAFSMVELEHYDINGATGRDAMTTPLPALYWTFHCFQLPEDEWRSPAFCSPVWCSLFWAEISLTSFEFREGLKHFRSEVVSTLSEYAIRIFNITDIATIDERDTSAQVAALRKDNNFLYADGDAEPSERYLRSDCVVKVGSFTYRI